MLGEGTIDDAIARVKRVKVYPLSNPQRTQNYFDLLEKSVGGEVDKGVGAFRQMHDYINKEPVQEKDKYPIGMLRSLGSEKGRPMTTAPCTYTSAPKYQKDTKGTGFRRTPERAGSRSSGSMAPPTPSSTRVGSSVISKRPTEPANNRLQRAVLARRR